MRGRVRNVLAVTGDPPEEGDYAGSHAVYDVDAIGLTQIVERMNRGEDYHGRRSTPTSFFVGGGQPDRRRPRRRGRALPTKDRRGRAVRDDADHVRPRLRRPLGEVRRAVADPAHRRRLAGPDPPVALRLHNEVPGIVVPDQADAAARRPNAPEVGAELTRPDRARPGRAVRRRLRRRAVPPPARRDRSSRRLTQTDR